jgi:hypothetical protein
MIDVCIFVLHCYSLLYACNLEKIGYVQLYDERSGLHDLCAFNHFILERNSSDNVDIFLKLCW